MVLCGRGNVDRDRMAIYGRAGVSKKKPAGAGYYSARKLLWLVAIWYRYSREGGNPDPCPHILSLFR